MGKLTEQELRKEIEKRKAERDANMSEIGYLKEQNRSIEMELMGFQAALDTGDYADELTAEELATNEETARQKRLLYHKYDTEEVVSVRNYWSVA